MIAAVGSLLVLALQLSNEHLKQKSAQQEHQWTAEREQRARQESYVEAILKAERHADRLFMADVIASTAPDASERRWAEGVKASLEKLDSDDKAEIARDQQVVNTQAKQVAELVKARESGKDPSSKAKVNEEVRKTVGLLATNEARLQALRARTFGEKAIARQYLCEVNGTAYPLRAAAGQADQACERKAKDVCQKEGQQVCEWHAVSP